MSVGAGVKRAVGSLLARVMVEKRRCYRACFQDDDGNATLEGERVLGDLKRFCKGDRSAFHENPYQHARLEGRREVWLRLRHHLDLTDEQVNRFVEVESEHY